MRFPIVIAVLALLTVASVVQSAIDVEWDRNADFSRYQTFAWKDGTPARRPNVQKRLQEMVEGELAGKGLRRGEDFPDVYVETHVLVDQHSLKDLADPGNWEFWTGQTAVDAYDTGSGTFVIDLIDGESGKLVWRGLASGTVHSSVEKTEKRLQKAIGRIFQRYPAP